MTRNSDLILESLLQVHCQISNGKVNNNIRYFANNVTVVDEQGRGGGNRKHPGDGGGGDERGRPQGGIQKDH